MNPYDDIINLPHHVSKTRKSMSMEARAAQFAPFAALTGHDAAIAETARKTSSRIDLSADEMATLSRKIAYALSLTPHPELHVTFFRPDNKKAGGTYITVRGIIKKVEVCFNLLTLTNCTSIDGVEISPIEIEIPLDAISDISSDIFDTTLIQPPYMSANLPSERSSASPRRKISWHS